MAWKIGDDILDTRQIEDLIDDLTHRSEHLDDCRDEYIEAMEGDDYSQEDIDYLHNRYQEAVEDFSVEDAQLLEDLLRFKDELEGYCDWDHGETLIHKDYREEYAELLAKDYGAISSTPQWPLDHIDWKAAAEELFRHDYTHAEIRGEIYYARCY